MVESLLHPIGHRHGPNVGGLSNQINNGPVIFAALNMIKGQINQLTSAQSAPKQDSQDGSVPLSFQGVCVGKLPEATSDKTVKVLKNGRMPLDPIAKRYAHTLFVDALEKLG